MLAPVPPPMRLPNLSSVPHMTPVRVLRISQQEVEGWHQVLVYAVLLIILAFFSFSVYGEVVLCRDHVCLEYPQVVADGVEFSVRVRGALATHSLLTPDDDKCLVVDMVTPSKTEVIYRVLCGHRGLHGHGMFSYPITLSLRNPNMSSQIEVLAFWVPMPVSLYLYHLSSKSVALLVIVLVVLPLFFMLPQEVRRYLGR